MMPSRPDLSNRVCEKKVEYGTGIIIAEREKRRASVEMSHNFDE